MSVLSMSLIPVSVHQLETRVNQSYAHFLNHLLPRHLLWTLSLYILACQLFYPVIWFIYNRWNLLKLLGFICVFRDGFSSFTLQHSSGLYSLPSTHTFLQSTNRGWSACKRLCDKKAVNGRLVVLFLWWTFVGDVGMDDGGGQLMHIEITMLMIVLWQSLLVPSSHIRSFVSASSLHSSHRHDLFLPSVRKRNSAKQHFTVAMSSQTPGDNIQFN